MHTTSDDSFTREKSRYTKEIFSRTSMPLCERGVSVEESVCVRTRKVDRMRDSSHTYTYIHTCLYASSLTTRVGLSCMKEEKSGGAG